MARPSSLHRKVPPTRLYAIATDDPDEPDGVWIDRFQIHGVATCTELRWERRDEQLKQPITSWIPLSDAQLEQQGYRPESQVSEIVPVILYSPFKGELDDEDPAEQVHLTLFKECELSLDPHEIVWCRWESDEDEQRLEPVIRRLKARYIAEAGSSE